MKSFKRKKEQSEPEPVLPTVREPSGSIEGPRSMDEKRKDSASVKAPSKPAPTRNPSTRIQEPVRASSQMKRNLSAIDRTKSTASQRPERPGLQRRHTTAKTKYIDMLLGLDNVPKLHNILASFSTWILLAGYIVFPATFNKLNDKELDNKADTRLESQALKTVRNVPLLYVAAFACGIGVLGCLWLWWKHRKNYVWVVNRIFLPALMNSIAGLISTLVNIYSAQDGQYSVTARATIIVTAALSVATSALFLLYNSVMLTLIRRKHDKETRALERGAGEGVMEESRDIRTV
ncbi:hypothetical protein BU23DRAFT_556459 [Bimuria novae-zelandiae CBS 107.79]|uniref:Uncharacterized protein n=1 Tax=Bimuria novae-zelandiae CBS 107.79 TaxID=1447943 RepID=A0A6A5VBW8_9PLEO|nr:hypothetical protein BU23DRAFT_556459 [Bimuria novae-zelandiae CBS 107.79]